jgi:hypothetical protein
LQYYGLDINLQKSSILIKGNLENVPAFYLLNNNQIPVTSSLKVLGFTLNSTMHRKTAIKPRVSATMRAFRSLLPSLKKLKAPLDLLLRLYSAMLVPMITFGLKVTSMTKTNASTLMRREVYIIKELANISFPRPPQSTIASLLKNKTINRQVSVYRIRYHYHVKRSKRGSLILQSINYKDSNKRKVGRPIFDFNDTLKKDFAKYFQLGITQSEMDQDYELRDAIKRLTSQLYLREDLDDDPMPIDLNLYSEQEMQAEEQDS